MNQTSRTGRGEEQFRHDIEPLGLISPGDVLGGIGVAMSWAEAIDCPSFSTIGGAFLDTLTEFVPFIPGTSVIRHGSKLTKYFNRLRRGEVAQNAGFVAGTPVTMADGTQKPIEQVKVGDRVLSRDEQSGQVAAQRVAQAFEREVDQTLVLTLANGERIETTAEHPFYVEGQGFVEAGRLGIGTLILTRAGPAVKLHKVEHRRGRTKVYNIEVEQFHTYFVGTPDRAVWVHNATKCNNLPELVFDHNEYPELADNIWHAQKAGHPEVLTWGGNRRINRTAALDPVKDLKFPGRSHDEYPFASTMEGGVNSWIGVVPETQQDAQGAIIRNFRKKHGLVPGAQFRVRVINHPGG